MNQGLLDRNGYIKKSKNIPITRAIKSKPNLYQISPMHFKTTRALSNNKKLKPVSKQDLQEIFEKYRKVP